MNFKALINTDLNRKARYDYYLSLGYSEKASEVLSTVTYGDESLRNVMKKWKSADAIEELHAWLSKRKGNSPEEAINASLRKRSGRYLFSAGFGVSSVGSASIMNFAGGGSKGRAVEAISDGSNDDESLCIESADDVDMIAEAGPYEMGRSMICEAKMPAAFAGSGFPADINMFQEAIATDQYETIEEKGAQDPVSAPTSTFRMTTSTASVGIILNQIRADREIDRSQVRTEELLNYFRYQEKPPKKRKFRISTEQMKKDDEKELLYVHVGAKEAVKEGQNIVLLLDVSGSMSSQRDVTQLAIATIVSKLNIGDRLSLITYSDRDETVIKAHKVKDESDKEQIMGKILTIVISGCTYGSAGIETAYRIGEKHYDADKNNQVILITDGDLNFGITEKDGLINLIEEKKRSDLFLSVIGTGLYNYKDDKLEALAKHGNGTYCVVNNLADVKESINRRYISLTNIVAKDVKAQMEFNPRYVKSYRLLGYENRALNHADFKDDTVISEPYGSGGYGVALYELTLGNAGTGDLKYQKPELTDLDEICTVKVRYKEPLSDAGEELEQVVKAEDTVSENLKLSWLLYCIGEKLRHSDKLDDSDERFYQDMIKNNAYRELAPDNREELELLISAIG